MSKKKSKSNTQPAQASKTTEPAAKSGKKGVLIIVGAIVVVIAAVVALGGNGGGKSGGVPTAEELKYMNRFLPAGYVAPTIGTGAADAAQVPINVTDEGESLSVAVKDVADNKIVSFKYAGGPEGEIPLLAYVKPSGKLFVGVDWCPPCQGVGQSFAGGTLTCTTCGTKREPESGAGISGSCKLYPVDELPAKVEGDKIVIEKADIDKYTPQPLDRPIGAAS